MHQVLAATVLLATTVCSMSAQRKGPDSLQILATVQQSRAAATAGLDTMRLLAQEHFQTLGFSDARQAARATLGTPMVEFLVRLDSLRTYVASTNPLNVLAGGDKVVYPVNADGTVRSSLEVARTRGAWRPVAYGGSTYITEIVRQRTQQVATTQRPESDYFIVRVAALGMHFLGATAATGFTLIPLVDDPRGRWKAGVALPAATILSQLSVDAKASNGLPI